MLLFLGLFVLRLSTCRRVFGTEKKSSSVSEERKQKRRGFK